MKKTYVVMVIAFYAIGFLCATFWDLPIEQWMTAHDPTWWSETAARIGPLPFSLTIAFCAAGLAQYQTKLHGLAVFLTAAFTQFAAWSLWRPESFLMLTISCLTGALLWYVLHKVAQKLSLTKRTGKILLGGILTACLTLFLSEVIKCSWGRPRYIFLDELGVSFRPWYQPHGFVLFDDRWKSFPSGHTIAASLTFYWVYLAELYPCLAKQKKTIMFASSAFVIFVAAGRVFAGRHFLSDVLMGMGVGAVVALLVMKYLVGHTQTEDSKLQCDEKGLKSEL